MLSQKRIDALLETGDCYESFLACFGTNMPMLSRRDRHERVNYISAPTSDSTTVIKYADSNASWIELGSDQRVPHDNGDIRQMLEFGVTSHKKSRSPKGETCLES